ncbi:MAG: hypothetical protein EP329_00075 [Deltaproteobacteria bacterium]|nr:MAG: hypothetical protein EP329_00075 [Deltaproteobacteria bacterium]
MKARRASLAGLALALFTLVSSPIQARADAPRWTVQVDPLTTALGYVHLQVERAVAPEWSIYAGPHLRLFDSLLDDKDEPYVGVGIELGVRWFFTGTAPEGGWAQIRGVLAYVTSDDPVAVSGAGGYVSALVGYTAILGDVFVLAGGAGVQYIDYGVGEYGVEGVFPAAHTTLGVAF